MDLDFHVKYHADTFVRLTLEAPGCNECVFEAWERMTYGGVQFGNLGHEHVHRKWGNDSLGVSHGYQRLVFGVDWGVTSSS